MPEFPNKIVRGYFTSVFLSAHGYIHELPQPIGLETKITIMATARQHCDRTFIYYLLYPHNTAVSYQYVYFTEELTLSGKLRTPQGHRDEDGNDVRFESQLWLASNSIFFMMMHCFKSLNSQHPAWCLPHGGKSLHASKALQSCLSLCNPLDCSPPGSDVHGILQARILEWVTMPSSKGSSKPRDWTQGCYVSCIGWWVLYHQHHLGSPITH